MVGLFASWWRGSVSCGLVTLSCAGLLATPASASTAESVNFAQAALVTNWSLPRASPQIDAMTEPASPQTLASATTLDGDFSRAPVGSASGQTRRSPVQLLGSDGPNLPAEDLEARGTAAYDREQPYRTPRDIKALAVAFQVLNAADGVTTLVCLKRENCHENNPIYGKHPKLIVVVGGKAAVGALHYLAMRSLARDHPGVARALGWVSVTIQGTVVGLNLSQLL